MWITVSFLKKQLVKQYSYMHITHLSQNIQIIYLEYGTIRKPKTKVEFSILFLLLYRICTNVSFLLHC